MKNVHKEITQTLLDAIKAKPHTWLREWSQLGVPLRHNGIGSRGINTLLLWAASTRSGYVSQYWMTYRQAQEYGANVRKGEKSSLSIKYGTGKVKKKTDAEKDKHYRFVKVNRVFNAEQIDGLPDKFYQKLECRNPDSRDDLSDAYAAAQFADIETKGDQPCYVPSRDVVYMPDFKAFNSGAAYYSTLWHELGHWTGHKSRLGRDMKGRFGDHAYAAEELIAELCAAFMTAQTGIELQHKQHAGYLQSWLRMFEDNERAIERAAADASKAADFMLQNYNNALGEAVSTAA